MTRLLLIILLSGAFNAFPSNIDRTLRVVRDSVQMFDSVQFSRIHFQLDDSGLIIEIGLNDTLALLLINNDSVEDSFYIEDELDSAILIPIGDSAQVTISFDQVGTYLYKDPSQSNNIYLGLVGLIVVKDNDYSSFYWNLKEYDLEWDDSSDHSNYDPEYFTINGKSFPATNEDSQLRVEGKVGDTIYIYITNLGNSIHSLHFHGYHATIVQSSKSIHHIGRSKDTFPIYPLEYIVLELIPNQAGEYPVHDHNLVAVSGNGSYTNGMFTTILIQP